MGFTDDTTHVMFSVGFCSVCASAGNAAFLVSARDRKVFYGCPECGCAWADPPVPFVVDTIDEPPKFAPDGFYVATHQDLLNAGLAHRIAETEFVGNRRTFEDIKGFLGWR